MKVRALAALAAVATCAWFDSAPALSPPISGAFPQAVLDAARAGVFAPVRPNDPGGKALFARPTGVRLSAEATHARAFVLPVDFAEDTATYSPETFRSELFTPHPASPGSGSAHDYYWDLSGHRLDLNGDVHPWVRAASPESLYAGDGYGFDPNDFGHNAGALLWEALRGIDSLTDFSPYDVDGDGFVDAVWLLHSGQGAESNPLDHKLLWSHASFLTAMGLPPYKTRTPWPGHPGQYLQINRYICVPELSGVNPGKPAEVGVFCHEYGHTLGLPDLYDTSNRVSIHGLGNWDLMCSGGYGGDGRHPESPTLMGAWCRSRLGWMDVTPISENGPLALPPAEQSAEAWRLWSDGQPGNEYVLLENREPMGWDRYLPQGGLLVTHVNDALISQGIASNHVIQIPAPVGISILDADGLDQLLGGVNRGDAGDVFPGASRNSTLDATTRPAIRDQSGNDPNVSLQGIRVRPDSSVECFAMVTPQRWSSPRTVPGPAGNVVLGGEGARSLAADPQGSLHLVWGGDAVSGSHVRYLCKRFGVLWDAAPMQLDSSQFAYAPSVAADSRGNVVVVWEQFGDSALQIMSRRRPLDGDWEPAVLLRESPTLVSQPTLAVDSRGTFYTAWAESPGAGKLPHIYSLSMGPDGQWGSQPAHLPDDSSSTNPALVVDSGDRLHVLYIRKSRGSATVYDAYHRIDAPPTDPFWGPVYGPLSQAISPQTPIVAAMDSSRVLMAWRQTGAFGDNLFTRVLDGDDWGPPNGPILDPLRSGAPIVALDDIQSGVLVFVWEDDFSETPRIRYQQLGIAGLSDATSHVLAGSDSSGAASPAAVWDSQHDLQVFWVESRGVRDRFRQGNGSLPAPPLIVPLDAAGPPHLGANHPNPVAARTSIPIEVPEPAASRATGAAPGAASGVPAQAAAVRSPVRLTLHDVSGRRVRVLHEGPLAPGRYEFQWDGTDASGRRMSSGVYFYRLDLGGGVVETRKLLLLR